MKNMILVLVLSVFSFQSLALEVLVTTDQPVSAEKMKEILSDLPSEIKSKEVRSFFDEQLKNPISEGDHEKMTLLLSQAEEESLNGRFKQAVQKYELLLKELDGLPNILGLQKIRQNAFIKLAELYTMQKDSGKSEIFWKRAYAWDSRATLDPEIFSPKSILKWRAMKKASAFHIIKIKAPVYSEIFLNGKKLPPFEKSYSLKVLPGKHQLAALVPGSVWQIRNFNSDDKNKTFEFTNHPIVDGDCGAPQITNYKIPAKTRLIAVFEKEGCSRVYDGQAWFDLQGHKTQSPEVSPMEGFAGGEFAGGEIKLEKQSWLGKAYKSPWFWVGIGALTAGTVLLIKSQEPVTVPSHTQSYRP